MVIPGKELLGLERTMSDSELAFKKQEEEKKSREEAEKLRKEMGPGRKVEEEITQLRKQIQEKEEYNSNYLRLISIYTDTNDEILKLFINKLYFQIKEK
jgi:hypothetical protein